jgi:branched-chain amino acid transport system ATP-binding protein
MLEVRGVDAFYGDAQALWAVDLDVGAAETVSIVGPNGAGKTTLANSITGIHRQRRGAIFVDGVDVISLPPHGVCGCGVAAVPEGRRVFAHMSVDDNLRLGAYRKGARRHYRDELERVYGLFPRLGERSTQLAGRLSGGEQQMLAVGRALMSQPRLLVLDEPSLGLAPVIVDEVFDVIRSISGAGVCVLLVEQEVERALDVSARGYVLVEGRIVTSGTADELRHSPELQSSVLGL